MSDTTTHTLIIDNNGNRESKVYTLDRSIISYKDLKNYRLRMDKFQYMKIDGQVKDGSVPAIVDISAWKKGQDDVREEYTLKVFGVTESLDKIYEGFDEMIELADPDPFLEKKTLKNSSTLPQKNSSQSSTSTEMTVVS